MCIAIIYSWDRFDNELQMLVIIWCDGPVTTKGFKDTDAWIPLKTRRAHISHKTKNYFSCYFKKKEKKKKSLTALASHLGLQQRCQGKVTDGCSTGRSAISARCTMPSNTSTIQGNSCDIASELCHLTTIHERARQQAKVSRSDLQSCSGEKRKKKKKREGAHEARAKWNLA